MVAEGQKLNLTIAQGTVDVWRAVATELDLIADRGPQKGQGSISGLMNAIAGKRVKPYELADALTQVFREGLCEVPIEGQLSLDEATSEV